MSFLSRKRPHTRIYTFTTLFLLHALNCLITSTACSCCGRAAVSPTGEPTLDDTVGDADDEDAGKVLEALHETLFLQPPSTN